MSELTTIARPYAKAAFDFAIEQSAVEKWTEMLGFAAAVYTQTTDVEGEVNGLMTYDRKVIKIDETAVKKANQSVINELK